MGDLYFAVSHVFGLDVNTFILTKNDNPSGVTLNDFVDPFLTLTGNAICYNGEYGDDTTDCNLYVKIRLGGGETPLKSPVPEVSSSPFLDQILPDELEKLLLEEFMKDFLELLGPSVVLYENSSDPIKVPILQLIPLVRQLNGNNGEWTNGDDMNPLVPFVSHVVLPNTHDRHLLASRRLLAQQSLFLKAGTIQTFVTWQGHTSTFELQLDQLNYSLLKAVSDRLHIPISQLMLRRVDGKLLDPTAKVRDSDLDGLFLSVTYVLVGGTRGIKGDIERAVASMKNKTNQRKALNTIKDVTKIASSISKGEIMAAVNVARGTGVASAPHRAMAQIKNASSSLLNRIRQPSTLSSSPHMAFVKTSTTTDTQKLLCYEKALLAANSPEGLGARVPDMNNTPTTTYHLHGQFVVDTAATDASFAITANPFEALCDFSGQGFSSDSLVPYGASPNIYGVVTLGALENVMASCRVVSAEYVITSNSPVTEATGWVDSAMLPITGTFPNGSVLSAVETDPVNWFQLVSGVQGAGFGDAVLSIPGAIRTTVMALSTNSLHLAFRPCTPDAFVFHNTSADQNLNGVNFYTVGDQNISGGVGASSQNFGATDPFNYKGFPACLVSMSGMNATTQTMVVEYTFHLEGSPQFFLQGGNPAPIPDAPMARIVNINEFNNIISRVSALPTMYRLADGREASDQQITRMRKSSSRL